MPLIIFGAILYCSICCAGVPVVMRAALVPVDGVTIGTVFLEAGVEVAVDRCGTTGKPKTF